MNEADLFFQLLSSFIQCKSYYLQDEVKISQI